MNEFIASSGWPAGRWEDLCPGVCHQFRSGNPLFEVVLFAPRRCQKLKHRSAKVAQILNASPFIYLAVEQLFRVTMWARSSGWLWLVGVGSGSWQLGGLKVGGSGRWRVCQSNYFPLAAF